MRELALKLGYAPHIRARVDEIALKLHVPGWRVRRWVEEAAHSGLNRNRALIAIKKAHAARLAAALQG